MQPFTQLTAIAAPIDEPNVDTNQLCPTRFNKVPRGPQHAQVLFHDRRFDADGTEKDFVLNREPYRARADHRRRPQLGLRLVARERGLCALRVRHPLRDRVELRRHPREQLLQERPAAGGAVRTPKSRDIRAQLHERIGATITRRSRGADRDRSRRAGCIASRSTRCARSACWKASTTSRGPTSTASGSRCSRTCTGPSGRGCSMP